jgi:hypothetical protein
MSGKSNPYFLIQGTNVTSGMPQQLASQLLSDGKLKDYIYHRQQEKKWTPYTFNSIAWREYKTSF